MYLSTYYVRRGLIQNTEPPLSPPLAALRVRASSISAQHINPCQSTIRQQVFNTARRYVRSARCDVEKGAEASTGVVERQRFGPVGLFGGLEVHGVSRSNPDKTRCTSKRPQLRLVVADSVEGDSVVVRARAWEGNRKRVLALLSRFVELGLFGDAAMPTGDVKGNATSAGQPS